MSPLSPIQEITMKKHLAAAAIELGNAWVPARSTFTKTLAALTMGAVIIAAVPALASTPNGSSHNRSSPNGSSPNGSSPNGFANGRADDHALRVIGIELPR